MSVCFCVRIKPSNNARTFSPLIAQNRQNPLMSPVAIAKNPEHLRMYVAVTATRTETVAFVP